MRLERTTTGLIIHDASDEIKRKVLRYFSLSNPVREFFIYHTNAKKDIVNVKGYIEDSLERAKKINHDTIYITSGFLNIRDQVIQNLPTPKKLQPHTPAKIEVKMNREPRSPLQEDCIKKMITSKSEKITIELKPGVGKTFIALYAISKLHLKPLIVCPTTLLKNQWIEEIIGLGIDSEDIARNIYDGPDKKVTVVTVSSIENAIRDDWDGLLTVISKASYGIKVIDESHLHLKGVLKLDAICNIPHNWYLSATLGRSDPSEDNILNKALSDADRFIGNANYVEYQKRYVNILFQDIYYHPSNELCMEHFKYGSKGLIRASYYNMLLNYNEGRPFIQNLIVVAKSTRSIIKYDGKILILVPLIEIIDRLEDAMAKDPFFKKYMVAGVDGSMSLAQRREAMECDYIISTSMSMGTGVDVKNLAAVVNFDQYSSPIINEQIFGRLRDRGKETWYIDICDHVRQAKMIENWGRKRRAIMPYFPGACTNIEILPRIDC